MTALLLTLAAFASWCLIGIALLSLLGAATGQVRVALTAPVVGSCGMLIPTFVLSHAGMAVEHFAVPLVICLLVASALVVTLRRPRIPLAAIPVLIVCAGQLLLAAQPMFDFGFHWIANANDDMANYTLSAQQLLHHGLLAPIDVAGLAKGTDYATTLTGLHLIGSRPGSDLILAVAASITRRLPYEVFMPIIFALNLCCICAAGALAMQASRRWWAATLAALLLAISPLATFGVLQQLIAQVWGLATGTALFALLLRRELYRRGGYRVGDGVVLGLLVVALVIVYVELASALAVGFFLYLVVLAVRRWLSWRSLGLVLLTCALVAIVLLNTYLPTELNYVHGQASAGVGGGKGVPLFGFTLVPSALPGILGLQELRALTVAPKLGLSIGFAGIVMIAILCGCVISARRGTGAAVVLLGFAALGAVLAASSSDFGLYKLFMYVQPFLAAAVAVWIASDVKWFGLGLAGIAIVVLVAQLSTQNAYIRHSRDPVELPNASSSGLMPAFRAVSDGSRGPIVAVSENPTLIKLQAQVARGRPVFFIGQDAFAGLLTVPLTGNDRRKEVQANKKADWPRRAFNMLASNGPRVDSFGDDTRATAASASSGCELVIPTGSEVVINRRSLPEGSPGLTHMPCTEAQNLLAFVPSELGEGFYLPQHRGTVSFYQLEHDFFFPAQTFAGFGTYVLFRVLGPSAGARLELDFSTTLQHRSNSAIPVPSVVGETRTSLPVVGDGSARVFSDPLRYQMIEGVPYLLLDLGRQAQLARFGRTGLNALYGQSEITDPRFLTADVRSISLVGAQEYRRLDPPSALRSFPNDLRDHDLEYSGIYEDGWIGQDSYAVLAGGAPADLVVQGAVPPGAGGHLQLLVNGRVVASPLIAPGDLNLRARVPASSSRRRIELRFASAIRLHAPDNRLASARLMTLALEAPTQGG